MMEVQSLCDEDATMEQLGSDDNNQRSCLLKEIENDCESVFSWDLKRLSGEMSQNVITNRVDKMRGKCEIIVHTDDEFNLKRFCLQLIISYELYTSGQYNESLMEMERVVTFMESCKYDESKGQYLSAFSHIAQTSKAYITLTLNPNSENIMKNIKPKCGFSQVERAAICAVKAIVFMEYPPKGNDIALKFGDEACNLHSTEPEWIMIWLQAKGRVRRYYDQFIMPEEVEIKAAEVMSTSKTKPQPLIQAADLYMEIAYHYKMEYNKKESYKYYGISKKLILKAIELAKDDTEQLYYCLLTYVDFPKQFHLKTVIGNVIKKLSNVKHSHMDQVLGKYYLKQEKDLENARIHISRAMAAGHFSSALQLIKVECLLQPMDKFPLVQTLNMIYDIFSCPKRRLIILSQILIYYYYNENNPKELMHYLKLYMDQHIDDSSKRQHLIFAHPLFKVNGHLKPKQFLHLLSLKLNVIKSSQELSSEENDVTDDTFKRFDEMAKVNYTYQNQYLDDNSKSTGANKQNDDNSSNQKYRNKRGCGKRRWQSKLNYPQKKISKSID